MARRTVTLGGLLGLFLFLLMPACTGAQKQTAFMKSSGKINVSAEELRIRMRDQAAVFAAEIEEAADSILDRTDDPELYDLALLWKSRAIPAAFQTTFRPDPLLALLDSWAFSIQMRYLFQRENVQAVFGEFLPVAQKAITALENSMEQVALTAAVENDVSFAKQQLETWAQENPIRSRSFARTSITQHMQDRAVTERKGGLSSVGTLTVDLADMMARLGLYIEHMPKQLGWETELILNERLPTEDLSAFLHRLPDSLEGLDETAKVLDDLPALVSQERAIILDEVNLQRDFILDRVREDLERTYRFVEEQRAAAFADVRVEREAAQDEIQRQRVATLEAIREERELAFEDAEAMALRLVDRAAGRLEATVDRVLIKTGLFLAAALVLITLAGLFLLRRRRPLGAAG